MIVGISGRLHSGKDSAGAVLVEKLGFKRVAFADGVREFVAAVFDWPLAWVNSPHFKDMMQAQCTLLGAVHGEGRFEIKSAYRGMRGRELLQRVGTEAARKVFGDDCWIKVAMAKCAEGPCVRCGESFNVHRGSEFQPSTGVLHFCNVLNITPETIFTSSNNYVITDVRFQNEYEAIKAAGGKVIRLNRAESVGTCHEFCRSDTGFGDGGDQRHCSFTPGSTWGNQSCGLPPEAHPSSFSEGPRPSEMPQVPRSVGGPARWVERHPSETSLPDESNDTIKYDGVLTGDMAHNVQGVQELVQRWIK